MRDPLIDLAELLERHAIDYALIGGHAVNAWLEPRFTADVDVTVAAGTEAFARVKAALATAGYTQAVEHGADLPSRPDFVRFVSNDARVTLEVQAAKTELQRDLLRRARAREGTLRVAPPEDLIVLKLIANRPKDRVDLEGLVELPSLDWDYVEKWAREWDVHEELSRLRAAGRRPGS